MTALLTKAQALVLCNAHDITLDDPEEAELLLENNPTLYEAYEALIAIADGASEAAHTEDRKLLEQALAIINSYSASYEERAPVAAALRVRLATPTGGK